jgi:hypothetical protein
MSRDLTYSKQDGYAYKPPPEDILPIHRLAPINSNTTSAAKTGKSCHSPQRYHISHTRHTRKMPYSSTLPPLQSILICATRKTLTRNRLLPLTHDEVLNPSRLPVP